MLTISMLKMVIEIIILVFKPREVSMLFHIRGLWGWLLFRVAFSRKTVKVVCIYPEKIPEACILI